MACGSVNSQFGTAVLWHTNGKSVSPKFELLKCKPLLRLSFVESLKHHCIPVTLQLQSKVPTQNLVQLQAAVIRCDHQQNADLPRYYSKKEKKPFPVPIVELRRAARERFKKSKGLPRKPPPPPKVGLVVKSLIPVAYDVFNARITLINNVKKLFLLFPYICENAARIFFGASLPPLLKPHNSFRFKVFPLKHSTWRTPHTNGFPNKRRPAHASMSSFCLVGKFGTTYDELNMNRRCQLSRHIVRSDLSLTGSAGAAYPLSEFQADSKLRGICFYVVTSFVAIFLFMLMLVSHPFVLFFDRYRRKAHHLIAKLWAFITVAPFLKIEFEGLDNLPAQDAPAVYVSNHQSFLDIYTLLTLGRSFKFISKTSIFLYPIIGWAMYFLGTIPLKRLDSRSQLDCLRRCMDLVKKGASVFIFPEGTRSRNGSLGTFKKGAFSVAAKTGVPVVPITLIGTGKIMPAGMEGRLNPGAVKVVVHQPILGEDPNFLCNKSRNVIADVLIREGYEVQ